MPAVQSVAAAMAVMLALLTHDSGTTAVGPAASEQAASTSRPPTRFNYQPRGQGQREQWIKMRRGWWAAQRQPEDATGPTIWFETATDVVEGTAGTIVVRRGGGLERFIPDLAARGNRPTAMLQRSAATGGLWQEAGEILDASEAERSVIDFLGLQALTPARFEAAKADAAVYQVNYPFNTPFIMRGDDLKLTVGDADPNVYSLLTARVQSAPFLFWIESPYTRVIQESWSRARIALPFVKPPYSTIEAFNRDGVRLCVQSQRPSTDAIQSVLIKRGAVSLRPLKTDTIKDTTLFTFDYSAFTPDMAVTIVLDGRRSHFEWEMSARELRMLR